MAAAEGLPQDLVFVDLETTGGNSACDRITEIGIVRVTKGELVEEWSALVNPDRFIPAHIESFTGISNEMVAAAPRFADMAAQVREKLQGAVFVAHNARFDYSFLRSEFRNAGLEFSARVLCTVKLSRRLFPEFIRHNLDAVMQRHGLTCRARHRALGDAQVLADLWFKLRREMPEEQLAGVVHAILGAHRLPPHLPPGLADELPEGPGAYRFFGADDELLFVGNSNSLRSRVCRHFSGLGAESQDRRLGALVRRVDWLETAGELGAMLRSAEWIKARRPLFNRRNKGMTQSHTLRAAAPAAAGAALKIEAIALDGLDPDGLMQCFGVFHSAKDARKALSDIADAQRLCRKVLGLEDGAGSCLGHQNGRCKGACIGKEPLLLHNTRLQLALSSLKLKAWPFPGKIALPEHHARGGFPRAADVHVLDRWAYIGTARSDEELDEMRTRASAGAFDVDVYRILVRHFAKNPRLDWLDLRVDASRGPAALTSR